jgi:hypothetical protein
LRDVQIQDNPPITARYFAFQYIGYNETQVVLYWYEPSTFVTSNTVEQKEREISLISYSETPQETAEAENAMLPFAKAITCYWQPITTWAPLALILSQNGLNLTPLVLSLLAGTVIFHIIERGRYRRAKTKAYNKVSEEDQEILDAAWQTKQRLPSTPLNIAVTYENTSHRTLTREVLVEELRHAEESGLASSRIINHSDEPLMTWKANFDKPATGRSGPIDILRRRLKRFF